LRNSAAKLPQRPPATTPRSFQRNVAFRWRTSSSVSTTRRAAIPSWCLAGCCNLHRWGLLEAVVAAGTPAVRAGQFSYGDDVETVEVAAAGLRHVWEAAARVPVSDGHSCREHCDAAMVYDSGPDADEPW